MQTDGLRLRIWLDSDGTAELEAYARSGYFSGLGSAWFNIAELTHFADSLAVCPLGEAAMHGIAGGYHGDRGLSEVHLQISLRQFDRAGHVAVRVVAATPPHDTIPGGAPLLAHVEFRTTYAALDRFVPHFKALLAGRETEAVLPADDL